MLTMSNVHFKTQNKEILSGLNIEVNTPELVAIMGANGAGKSTLLRVISGELSATQGEVKLLGKAYSKWPPKQLAKLMAVLPQSNHLNFPFLVEDVVKLGRLPHATGQLKDGLIANEMMQELDVYHLRARVYTELSGGEKQRVQLARVLAQIFDSEDNSRKLLLLDEPTNALDIEHQHSLMRFLKRLVGLNVAIVMVLHDFNTVAQYADKIISLKNGLVAAYGDPRSVLTPEHLKKVFNVDVQIVVHPDNGKPIVTV